LHYQNQEYQGGLQFQCSSLYQKEPLESNWNGLILHNHIYKQKGEVIKVEDVYCDMLVDDSGLDWRQVMIVCAILEYTVSDYQDKI
jgi:hypothetical protein